MSTRYPSFDFKAPIDIENFDADVDNTESEDDTKLTSALHPVVKERKSVAAPQKAGDTDQSSKKCLSPTDNETITTIPEDPKIPAQPLKKARLNKDMEKNLNGVKLKSKPQPVHRTGIISLILKYQ